MTIYLATGLDGGRATPMEDERIEDALVLRREIEESIDAGKIIDAKTKIGFIVIAGGSRYLARK